MVNLGDAGVGAEHALQGGLTLARLGEAMRGTGRDDAAGQQRVTGTLEGEGAGGSALVRAPDVAAEGQQAGEIVVDVEVTVVGGGAIGRADETVVAGERRPDAVTSAEIEIGVIVAGALGEITEGDGLPDGRRGSGSVAETVVDEEVTAGVIAEVKVAVTPIGQGRADFETAVEEVDILEAAVETEIRRIGHADPTATGAHLTVETILVALNPQRGGVGHPFLVQTVLARVVGDDLAGNDEITVTVERRDVAGAEGEIPRDGGDAGRGVEARFRAGTHRDATSEIIVADGQDGAGSVRRAGTATGSGDLAGDVDAGDAALDDERAAAEARITGVADALDHHRTRARAELGGVRDDDGAAADQQVAGEIIAHIGEDERAVAGLEQTLIARDLGGGGDPRTQGHAYDRLHGSPGRSGQSQRRRAGDLIRIPAGKIQSADRDGFAQRDDIAAADGSGEIRHVIERERAGNRRLITDGGGRAARVEPVEGGGVPGAVAAEAGRGAIGIPEQVRGLGGLGRTDGEERRGDHQRGAREEGTRLRTFH